ncbi:hypothetical protein [Halobacillus sp. Cin3]|uniref:hypothetical protein n=1 Tax=Halobacillus sp. Cin3 TaxID=2928441 RepID=UPI00248D9D4C|nr:hypothetical protein [Halobacillus sp. Cin3]
MKPQYLINIIKDIIHQERQPEPFRLGKVASTDGRVNFDGEQSAGLKKYKRLSNYTPSIGDRVLLARVKGSYVILGKIQK